MTENHKLFFNQRIIQGCLFMLAVIAL
ncbi:uncharacterized protein METZ01_LOCUS366249, partial [marine metagenome]